MDSDRIRERFPGTRDLVYFNAAAASLLPEPVARAMHDAARAQCRRGVMTWRDDVERVTRTREAAADLIGARSKDIAFVQNTAEGIGRVATGLDWRDGDEVVLGDLEYPANVYPWAAQRSRGVRVRLVRSESGRLEAERLIDALGPRTRVLAVSMVQFTSGYRVDLKALGRACEARGVLLVVDAIQGLGVFPVDVREMGIGALATDGRKWLMGPAACAFLYVRPDWVDRISPNVPGALSVTSSEDHLQYTNRLDDEGQIRLSDLYRPAAGRYETGFYNMVGLAGLSEALSLGDEIGRERIHSTVTSLAGRLVRGVRDRGWDVYGPRTEPERSGIVSFSVPASPEALFRDLNAAAFSISVRDGRLRTSPHVYNTVDEVDAFLSKLDELVRS